MYHKKTKAFLSHVLLRIFFPLVVLLGSVLFYVFFLTSKIVLSFVFLVGTWFLQSFLDANLSFVMKQHDYVSKKDNLKQRMLYTRMNYVRLLVSIVVFVIGLSIITSQYESLRAMSTGLLASAGIVGLVLAFAAQKSLANLLAGLQIAFTQPIRIDDVVIIEGEWGKIEEITFTYVIVKIWDKRRLVVPITYFIENPFQNWTRTEADITGSITWHLDHTTDIDILRNVLGKYLKKHELWDKDFYNIQVIETTDKTMVVRALVTAKDSSSAWDLRCDVREHILTYIQKNHKEWLPKHRLK